MTTALNRSAAPAPTWRRNRLAFTLIELLTVISIIAVLAGLVVGLAPVATAKMKEARVRGELAGLVTAIESYKSRFGVYPPDHSYATNQPGVGQTTAVDSVMNTLYYELTGVLVDNNPPGSFFTADDEVEVTSAVLENRLGREGIVNSLPRTKSGAKLLPEERPIKRRLFTAPIKDYQSCEIFRQRTAPGYVDLELLAVGHGGDASGKKGAGIAWPLNNPKFPPPVASNPTLNPWHYVSTNPTNNPTGFDLWAEIVVKGERKIIGNWNN